MERAEERLSWRWKNGIKNYSMQLRRRVAFEKQQNSEKRKVNCMFFSPLGNVFKILFFSSPFQFPLQRRKLDLSSLSSSVKSPSSSDSKVDESEEEKDQDDGIKNNNVKEGGDVSV